MDFAEKIADHFNRGFSNQEILDNLEEDEILDLLTLLRKHMAHAPLIRENSEEETNDYTLVDDTCWITVKTVSVYIRKCDDGVSVDLYELGQEDEPSEAGTWLEFRDQES